MSQREKQLYVFGPYHFDPEERLLLRDNKPVPLAPKVLETLFLLLQNAGHLVEKDSLMKQVWPDAFVEEGSLSKSISMLRKTLGNWDGQREYVETIPKRGYRFVGPVNLVDAELILSDYRGPTRHSGYRWFWSAGILMIAVLVGLGTWINRPLVPPRVVNVKQLTHDGRTHTGGLTDGKRLYVTETTGSKQFLVQVSATGGESTLIPTPFANIVMSDISPDGSEMLVADAIGTEFEFPVWVLPLPAGPPRRLGDIRARCDSWSTQGWATWSPDGRQIAFAKGSEIYLVNADGGNPRKLASVAGYASEMHFSPDGTHIRFTLRNVQENRSSSIWEVRSNGTELQPLLPGWHSSSSHMAGDWTRDGRYYFFTSADDNRPVSIWAMRETDGRVFMHRAHPVELTTGPMSVFFNGVSSDGKTIFAGGWTSGSGSELVHYDAGSRQFVPYLGGISAGDLDFSRDGKWVTYLSGTDTPVWRSRIDGSERLQLTVPPVSAMSPHWSPDGTQIAFVNKKASPYWQIVLIPAQGGIPEEVFPEANYQAHPTWSPDGRQLAYGRVPWLRRSGETIAIQIFDFESKKVSTVPGSQELFAPSWSPDGRYLAALSVDTKKLVAFDFKTKKWKRWVTESAAIEYPSWSKDSEYIYYSNTATGSPSYRRARIGRASEFVIDLGGLNRGGGDPSAELFGTWSTLAPDGSVLFSRNLSTDEVYSFEVELP
jgi:DNA-binding winged helix-turn-helix (wHTH) protein/Tol biopolymer transport system component